MHPKIYICRERERCVLQWATLIGSSPKKNSWNFGPPLPQNIGDTFLHGFTWLCKIVLRVFDLHFHDFTLTHLMLYTYKDAGGPYTLTWRVNKFHYTFKECVLNAQYRCLPFWWVEYQYILAENPSLAEKETHSWVS